MQRLKGECVDTQYVVHDAEVPTGVAFIMVDALGENSIVVADGANGRLSLSDIEQAMPAISGADVLLAQLESPLDAVAYAIQLARRSGALVMLNPAPGQPLDPALLCNIDILTPNRLEAEMITGMKISDDSSLRAVAKRILDFGIQHAIITLGSRGVMWATGGNVELLPAYRVDAIDSTGAGDVFSGSLAAFLAGGMAVKESVKMAIAAASISVTRLGAQQSAPRRSDVDAFISLAAHTAQQALI
jgi:ribokinase